MLYPFIIPSVHRLIFAPVNIRQNIPNFITLGNLFCGCIALSVASSDLQMSILFVLLAALLDFLDGLVARLMKVSSPLGKQLDSLADVVSFGVVPAFWLFLLSSKLLMGPEPPEYISILCYSSFIMVLGGAWRLARFNIDTAQTSYFKGLPIPANGILWVGILLSYSQAEVTWDNGTLVLALSFLNILISLLMVSTIKLLNFKFSHLKWSGNESRYLILICAPVIAGISIWVIHSVYAAIPAIILLYIVISITHFYILGKNEIQG